MHAVISSYRTLNPSYRSRNPRPCPLNVQTPGFHYRSDLLLVFLVLRSSELPVFRSSGFLVLRFSGLPVLRSSGFLVFWFSGSPVLRFSGFLGFQFFGLPVFWLSSFLVFQFFGLPPLRPYAIQNSPSRSPPGIPRFSPAGPPGGPGPSGAGCAPPPVKGLRVEIFPAAFAGKILPGP